MSTDALEFVSCDWNALGHYCGFRLSEWAQNEASYKKEVITLAPDGFPLGLIFEDLKFHGESKNHLNNDINRKLNLRDMELTELRFRF